MTTAEQLKADADTALRSGQLDQARRLYEDALSTRPEWAAAHNNLAMVLRMLGDANAAETHFRKALAAEPVQVGTLSNLGALLLEQDKLGDAAEVLDRAIAADSSHAGARYNRAKVYGQAGDRDAQIAALQEAIRLKPDFAEALTDLAQAYREIGRTGDVEDLLRRAIAANPQLQEPRINLGICLNDQGRIEDAIAAHRDAIALNPNNAKAHYNLGIALTAVPAHTAAVTAYSEALRLDPSYADAANNMAKNLQALGRLDDAQQALDHALRINPTFADAHSNLLMLAQYDPASTPQSRLTQAQAWQSRHRGVETSIKDRSDFRSTHDPDPDRPLRIGFVSPNLNRHPVGSFLTPLLESSREDGVEVIVYCDNRTNDDVTDRLRGRAAGWHDISGSSHADVADSIHTARIDILFDLAGHTGNNRMSVFAGRAAPVQVTWAGYVGTTGLDAMDYLLTDDRQTRASDLPFMTEMPVYMPGNYVPCLLPEEAAIADRPPAADGKSVTFGCFNNAKKLNAGVIEVWSKILNHVENASLTLIAADCGDPDVCQWLTALFASHGVSAERLTLMGKLPHSQLLEAYNTIDIALDPFPYSGGLTTLEALWMGVPVVTRADSDRFAGRHSVTHLTAAGVPELIAANAGEYVDLAVGLAASPERVLSYKASLRDGMRRSPICDGPAYARFFEKACRLMWQQWCRGESPTAISPDAIAGDT